MFGFGSDISIKDTSPMATNFSHPESGQEKPSARRPSSTFFFLRTKLLPPRPVPELLLRPRLTERLLANLAHPMTLITANAGSGKTTLVADFVRKHNERFIWYQLDHTDADPFVFLGYVTNGIKQIVEGFGEITLSYLQQSADELARQPERAVDVLLNEVLESVEQRLILVLDDYHHLGTETAVHRVVDRLLAYLPDLMHVIIISRDIPPLALARLRSQSSLAVIDRNDLLFTDEETQELFRKVFDLEITPEQLIEYRERTHGWITALQLVRQVAQRQAFAGGALDGEAPDLIEILRQSEYDIFDYFAEEVFADEAEEVQTLLLRIALLDRVEASLCTQLYPDLNCRSLLPALVRRNVFITVASGEGGEEYRLHPLFQSFLRRRLRLEIGRAGIAAEQLRLGEYFLAFGQWEQGVRYLLRGEEFERAAAVIAEHGGEWISAGALSSLLSFTEAMPVNAIEKHPKALAYQAEVLRLRGDYDAAQSLLRRAATLLQESGDKGGEGEALHSLATIARRRGDYETAFSYLDRAAGLTEKRTAVHIKCGNTRGLCLMAVGDLSAAEREFRAALHLAEAQGDEHYVRLIAHNLGLPAMVRGDFGEALRWLKRMLRDSDDLPPMPRDATAYLNLARSHLYRGDFEICEKHLNLALACSQLFNLTALRGEIFETYGNFYRESGDVTRALEYYERAGRAYEEAGIDLTHKELLEEQAVLCLQVGDLSTARLRIDQLIEARTAAGDELGALIASLARGRIRLAQGEGASAGDELQTSCNYFRKQGLHYYEAQASMALAVCASHTGKEGEMLEHLRRALALAVSYDYEYWLQREVTLNQQLFAMPDACALLPAELREQVAVSANATPKPVMQVSVTRVASPPVTDLTMNLLGHVEIFRDPSHPLTAEVWTTRRARDILCFIASRPHRRASKDAIIDTFWGEADFDVVEKNFHPTVSHIRKALNSKQTLKQNFILYRDGDYQLNPDFSYRIDTEAFDRLLAEGEAARRARDFEKCARAYEEAIALYRGEFMKGCYDSWMEEPRAYYLEQYLRMLMGLTEIAQKNEDWTRALELSQKILRDDPFREDIYCKMMRAHAALGNRVAVKEQFEALRKLLQKELGVDPAAETRRLYKELLQ
jgi:LuxR family maltose regulon positive regulatory protein